MNLAIFDLDGTLIEANSVEDGIFTACLQTVLGLECVDPDWSGYPDVTDPGLATEAWRRARGRSGPDPERAARFRELYCRRMAAALTSEHVLPVRGAGAFLQHLGSRGDWAFALATGNYRPVALRKIELSGLEVPPTRVTTADDAPDRPGLLRAAMAAARRREGVASFDGVVAIGDGEWDRKAAREAGLGFVLRRAPTGAGERAGGDRAVGPVLPDYTDLTAALATLSGARRSPPGG